MDSGDIDAAVAVPCVQSIETVDGVDKRYEQTNGIRLVKRDGRFRSPDVTAVEDKGLKWSWGEGRKGMVPAASRSRWG